MSGECPPGTTQENKQRRGDFASRNPVWRDEDDRAHERDGAGSWEQAGLMDEPLPEPSQAARPDGGGRDGNSGSGDRRQLTELSRRHGNSVRGTRVHSKHTASLRPALPAPAPLRRAGLLGSSGLCRLQGQSALPLPLQGLCSYHVSFGCVQLLSRADVEGQLRHPQMPSVPRLP